MKKIQKNRRKTGADYEKAAGFYLEQINLRKQQSTQSKQER